MKRLINIILKISISCACMFAINLACFEHDDFPSSALEGESISVTDANYLSQDHPVANATVTGRYKASHRIYETILNDEQRRLYDAMLNYLYSVSQDDYCGENNVENDGKVIGVIRVPNCGLSDSEISQTWYALNEDHLELFYAEEEYLLRESNSSDVIIAFGCFNEFLKKAERDLVYSRLDEHLSVLRELTRGMEPLDKAAYVCRYMAGILEYADDENYEPIINETTSTIACIMDGRAICDGYSRLYGFFCNQLDIECIYATGFVEEGHHAWNYVHDGEWYAVDTTFYDCGVESVLLAGEYFFEDHHPDYTEASPYQGYGDRPFGNLPPRLAAEGYFNGRMKQSEGVNASNSGDYSSDNQNTHEVAGNAGDASDASEGNYAGGNSATENADDFNAHAGNMDSGVEENAFTETVQPIDYSLETGENDCGDSSNIDASCDDGSQTAGLGTPETTTTPTDLTNGGATGEENETIDNNTSSDYPVFEDPTWGPYMYYYNMAVHEQEAGDLQNAITHYVMCLEYYQDHGAMFNMGNAYAELGDVDSAVYWYMRAYDAGDDLAVCNCLYLLQTSGLDMNTRIAYDHYVEQHAPVAEVYAELAQAYQMAGNEEMAGYYQGMTY